MATRRHLSNAVSANLFIKTAYRTNAKNIQPVIMQGGYRL